MTHEPLFNQKLHIINIGLLSFMENLKSMDADVIHVDWRPPGDGDPEIMAALTRLKQFMTQND